MFFPSEKVVIQDQNQIYIKTYKSGIDISVLAHFSKCFQYDSQF